MPNYKREPRSICHLSTSQYADGPRYDALERDRPQSRPLWIPPVEWSERDVWNLCMPGETSGRMRERVTGENRRGEKVGDGIYASTELPEYADWGIWGSSVRLSLWSGGPISMCQHRLLWSPESGFRLRRPVLMSSGSWHTLLGIFGSKRAGRCISSCHLLGTHPDLTGTWGTYTITC